MEARDLPDLKALRPERYVRREMLWSGEPLTAFRAEGPEDFDWLTVEASGDDRELGVGVRAVRLEDRAASGLTARVRRRLPPWLRRLAP